MQDAMIQNLDEVFNYIIELVGVQDSLNIALEVSVDKDGRPMEVGLWDAQNKMTQLILWLYSIEPSIATDLNETCRNMIKENLPTLGPFACALNCILFGAE